MPVSKFSDAFGASCNAVKNRRTALLLSVLAFMAVDTAIREYSEHKYVLAVLAPVFFLVVMPWLGWNWIKPKD
jgi:hypothetical protein